MGANKVVEAVALVVTLDRLTNAPIVTWSLRTLVLAIVNVQSGEDISHQRKLPSVDDYPLHATTEHVRRLDILVNVMQAGHSPNVEIQWKGKLRESPQRHANGRLLVVHLEHSLTTSSHCVDGVPLVQAYWAWTPAGGKGEGH